MQILNKIKTKINRFASSLYINKKIYKFINKSNKKKIPKKTKLLFLINQKIIKNIHIIKKKTKFYFLYRRRRQSGKKASIKNQPKSFKFQNMTSIKNFCCITIKSHNFHFFIIIIIILIVLSSERCLLSNTRVRQDNVRRQKIMIEILIYYEHFFCLKD